VGPDLRMARVAVCTATIAALSLCAAPAQAVSWERAWGKDVINDGLPVGPEICVVAASCKIGASGTAAGEFQTLAGVAADGQNIYVLEGGASPRVSKFDSAGHFISMWGKNVDDQGGTGFEICTDPLHCQGSSSGNAAGEMNQPRDIAVSPGGDVYVADFGNSRIQRYDSNGNFVAMWGKGVAGGAAYEVCTAAMVASCAPGGVGNGPGGEFNGPNAVAVDELGQSVYVGEETAERVEKFDSNGNFDRMWGKSVVTAGGAGPAQVCTDRPNCKLGTPGSLDGEFDSVLGVAADSAEVYVVEDGNARVQRFNPSGAFTLAWGKDVRVGGGNSCTTGNCQGGSTGPAGGEFNNPSGIVTDFHGNPYVADNNSNRIQKFDSSGAFQVMWGRGVASGPGFEECTASCAAGIPGPEGGQMEAPNRVASDGNGSVFVADGPNLRIQKFLDGAVAAPAVETIAPGLRGSDNAPRIIGEAQAGTTVRIFSNALCTGTPVTGTAAEFASPGIPVTVPDDSVTDFSANARSGVNYTSPCSSSLTYTEDSTGPDTVIDSAPSGTIATNSPSFAFHATEPDATFQCRFDGQPFVACFGPPGTHTPLLTLADGTHTFEVRALDDLGNPDASPAAASFKVNTAQGLPPPVRGRLVNAIPEKGTVLVKLPKVKAPKAHAAATGFVPLETVGRQLPVGTTLDTKKGTVLLTAATNTTGGTQDGHFSQGLFVLGQTKKNPLTTLSMTGGGLGKCATRLPTGGARKEAADAAKRGRRLFSDVKGRFRTRGRNSTATVRGTKWTMTDTCAGTRTTVKTGSVTVRDFTLRKTRIVKAGHSYLARAPKAKRKRG
jgi:NHL repeat